jgi:hypothetical protein
LRIEPVLHNGPANTQPASISHTDAQSISSAPVLPTRRSNGTLGDNHPVIQALKRELGAEPVE